MLDEVKSKEVKLESSVVLSTSSSDWYVMRTKLIMQAMRWKYLIVGAHILVFICHCSSFIHDLGTVKGLMGSSRAHLNMMSSQLSDVLVRACSEGNVEKLDCSPIFETLVQSTEFKKRYWQKEPYLCSENLHNLDGAFTMKDVESAVESDFLEAGRGTFVEGKSGWNMAAVSQVKPS